MNIGAKRDNLTFSFTVADRWPIYYDIGVFHSALPIVNCVLFRIQLPCLWNVITSQLFTLNWLFLLNNAIHYTSNLQEVDSHQLQSDALADLGGRTNHNSSRQVHCGKLSIYWMFVTKNRHKPFIMSTHMAFLTKWLFKNSFFYRI